MTTTPPPKGFTLVEIMIVILIIAILLSIAIPSFNRARATSRTKACVNNLRQIQSAKEQWALDNRKPQGDTSLSWPNDLVGSDKYIKGTKPVCPSTGANYIMNPIGTSPWCTNWGSPDGIPGQPFNHELGPGEHA